VAAIVVYAAFSALVLGIRLSFRWKTRNARVAIKHESWHDGVLAWSAFAAMLILPIVGFATPFLRVGEFVSLPSAFWAGAVLLGLVVCLFWRAHADLGLNWSINIQMREGHSLVTGGIYSRLRHPMYAALLLSAIALVPVLHNWIVSLIMLLIAGLFVTVRASEEERFLSRAFGDGYREYATRTGRIVPRFRSGAPAPRWPHIPGKYVVVDSHAPVAVATLGSVVLPRALADASPRGLCIVGKVETENIGIEKIVQNVVANPAIRFLVCAGEEPPRHRSGATLLALFENGVDAGGRIVGSPGRRPILRNTTAAQIAAFRSQVEPVDMIGCVDVKAIATKVHDLAARAPSVRPLARVPARLEPAATLLLVAGAPPPDRIKLDQAGYFVIHAGGDQIVVEHYDYQERLLRSVEGCDARTIYWTLIANGWVTKLDHAAYLGKELARAEYSLKAGLEFVQDGA
jgi:tetrahydromethanopterin S-methyltransferase subunit A